MLNISFEFEYLPLLLVVTVAWLTPILLSLMRLRRIPIVIVEIIVGYVIGRYFFGYFSEESLITVEFLALTGFIFLMFLGGLEIDVDQIVASFPKRRITYSRFLKNPLLVGLTIFVITLVLSFLSAKGLGFLVPIKNPWYFSLIMVTTSIGIVIPVIKSRGEIQSRFGQMIITTAAIADILSIVLFTFTAVILNIGFNYKLIFIPGLFLTCYIFYQIGKRLNNISIFKKLTFQLSHAASQIQIRGSMFILLVFVVLSQLLGKEVILLGAFLAGLLLSFFLHKDRSLLLIKLDGMGYGFFIPVFFIMVGARFDPYALKEFDKSIFPFLLLLLVILPLVKVIPALLWKRFFGLKNAISAGFLISARLSLIIAASKIGLDMGLITPGMNSCFIIMAVVSCMISPILYNNLTPMGLHNSKSTIIVGGSSSGVLLQRRLNIHGKKAIIIEKNYKRFKEMKSKGLVTLLGDGKDPETYNKLKISPSNNIFVHTGSDKENRAICEMLQKKFTPARIISKTTDQKTEQKLKQLNIEVIDMTRIVATTIENLIVRPTTYHALVETFENYSVEEINMTNPKIDGLQVNELHFHSDGSLMLINRNNQMHVPHGDTYLKIGDEIIVFGTDAAIDDFKIKFKG